MRLKQFIFITAVLLILSFEIGFAGELVQSGSTELKISIPPTPRAETTYFAASPSSVAQGGYVDFTVKVKNTGNIAVLAQPTVRVYSSGGSLVGIRVFDPVNIPVGNTLTFIRSFSTAALPGGSYTAKAVVSYDGHNTTEVSSVFSVTVAAPPAISGGAGAGAPFAAPKLAPAVGALEFVEVPALVEVKTEESAVINLFIKNSGDADVSAKIKISGLPEGWVTVVPTSIFLAPGGYQSLNVIVKAPRDTPPADYKVTVGASDGATTETFFILRVKAAIPQQPTLTRAIQIDNEKKFTKMTLKVKNGEMFVKKIQIIERIPKNIANTTDQIIFDTPPTEIIEYDPTVSWDITNMAPYESRTISYEVAAVLKEWTDYVTWTPSQVVVAEKIELIKIVQISSPALSAGESKEISATVTNLGSTPLNLIGSIEIPNGWGIKPQIATATLSGGASTDLKFTLTSTTNATAGTYLMTLKITYDNSELSKDFVILIQPPFLPINLTFLISVFLIAFVAVSYKRMSEAFRKVKMPKVALKVPKIKLPKVALPPPAPIRVPSVVSAKVVEFTPSQTSVVQGGYVDFTVKVKNTGDVAFWGQPTIRIYSADGKIIDILMVDPAEILSGSTLTFVKAWWSGGVALGKYIAKVAVSFDGHATSEEATEFSIVAPAALEEKTG